MPVPSLGQSCGHREQGRDTGGVVEVALVPREVPWLCRSTRLGFEPLNQCSMQVGEQTDPLPKGACKQLPEGPESLGKM